MITLTTSALLACSLNTTAPAPAVPLIDQLCAGKDVSEGRRKSLQAAIELGADRATLETLRDTPRLSKTDSIVLPAHRFENLSRGKGWARKGKGARAEWADRVEGGYQIETEGRWTIGGNDGFSRKDENIWIVSRIKVGDETWTIAK